MTTDNLIKWSTVLAVAAVAIVAGWVSYVHALDVVTAHGEHGALAHLYPGTIDGLIYSASMVMLDAARRDVKAPKLAYWLLGAGITVTLSANILAGVAYGPLGAVVAAWPALALVGSYELLMVMIRRARTVPEAVADAVSIPAPEAVARTVSAGVSGPVADAAAHGVPDAAVTPQARSAARTVVRKRTRTHTPQQRAERVYAAHIADGQVPSLRAIMRDIGVGQDRAREISQHLATLAPANGTVDHG
jgi:hypothetical protein